MDGQIPSGHIVVYDDDSFYMGGLIAEKICLTGQQVTLVTPADVVSAWCDYTSERFYVQKRLLELGVALQTGFQLASYNGDDVRIVNTYTDRTRAISANALVMVTARQPNDRLYRALETQWQEDSAIGIRSVTRIGDCEAPALIAASVYAGHRFAREFDMKPDTEMSPRYE
jgi:dimethylamine/trimethylamine dehydrogenase